ncbi:MAG: hypothetical protein WD155_05360, partial [Burkholderiales bacterium]
MRHGHLHLSRPRLRTGVVQRHRRAQLDPEIDDHTHGECAERAHREEKRQARIGLAHLGLEHFARRAALRGFLRVGAAGAHAGCRRSILQRRVARACLIRVRANVFGQDLERRGDLRQLVARHDVLRLGGRVLSRELQLGRAFALGAALGVFLGLFGLLERLEQQAHV